jgi:hypothetical protein
VQTLVAVAVLLTAAVLSVVLRRRKPDAPAQAQGVVPHQVDRSDFDATQKNWLVAIFQQQLLQINLGLCDLQRLVRSPLLTYGQHWQSAVIRKC